MQTIRLTTWMDAPMERCFKLATSVDLVSAAATGEKAIGGVTSGLIGPDNSVDWQGRQFGRAGIHTSHIDSTRIDGWRPYSYFREVMVQGSFARFEHERHFALMDDGTRMRDEIRFSIPGLLSGLSEKLVRRHLVDILKRRNALIKQVAESEQWRRYLEEKAATPKPPRPTGDLAPEWDKSSALAH
ncbi:MAG: cell division protein [Acidobacteriales bacterium]|nr:cell division protein [Terriglobales bacterium]